MAQGYWNKAEASEALFRAALAAEADNSQTYLRTGDLGFLSQGELFIAGRYKDLIVVNGRNIYPQDLEHTAHTAHPAVRLGGVMAVAIDKGLRETVVLLLECTRRQPPEVVRTVIDEVRKQIAIEHELDLLEVVPLPPGALPRTSSGKPQRSAARDMYQQGALEPLRLAAQASSDLVSSSTVAPDALLLDTLTRLWTDVLGHDAIEPDANFFDLGGDSLLATQLVSRLRARLGIELPISALFEAPTVRGVARLVIQARQQMMDAPAAQTTVVTAPPAPASPRASGSVVPLSFSQERMWFMHELAPERSAYNIPLAMRLRGPVDVATMQTALARVVDRHEVLRTRFIKTFDGVVGEVVEAQAPALEEVNLVQNGGTPEEALHHHLARVTGKPFQLDQCPLFRGQLIHVGDQHTVLLIVMHHIVSDQWSFAEMGRELAAHYSALRRGVEPALPPLAMQYADYAGWHRSWFEGERRDHELAYWTRRLEGLEPLPLNEDFARPRQQSFQGAALRLPMAPDDIAALRRLGAAHGASLSMVLMAALNVVLYRHTGKTDIAIGVPIANRHHLSSENLIGTFVNTLVFRTDLAGDPDFSSVLARVRETSLEAFAHQDMPFEVLVRELASRPDASRQPLFNVMFNMVNSQARDCHFEGLTWSRLDFDRASTQFDLTVVADMLYDHSLVIEYATDLFTRETVQRMGEHLQNVLRAAINSPSVRVATLPLLGDAERASLHAWSQGVTDTPDAPPPARTVGEWLARGARQDPQQVALVFNGKRLTHRELDEASNRLARVLRQRGIARGLRVGLCLPRGHDLVVALLAILKTGAAYVPLDPDYPSQRLNYQIEDADLTLMVTHTAVAQALGREHPLDLLLDVHASLVRAMPSDPLNANPALDAGPEDAAYLIYTSGSTGQPKGVAVPHRAVVNFLVSMAHTPGLTPRDRLLAVTTPSFDIAVLELLLPLGVGGTVVIASEAQTTDGVALANVMAQENITVLQATPSRWHLLIDSGWSGSPGLKALVGGEPLTPSLALQLLSRCDEVWNMYGPTETTVWSSCWRVQHDDVQAISLGRPVAHTSVQVLDEHRNPCPIGVPGEIYIGGTGVALGYYKRPALTSERFIEQPEATEREHRRIYRTGDRGRWRHDGSLEHGGRLDDQIKLRGFRIELGEIETHLLSHPGIARAVVMLREDQPGQARLVAYVVPEGPMPAREALRQHLQQWLPDHMVPGVVVELDTIPVLPNGKTNRRALPTPHSGHAGAGADRVAPRNATEQAIWTVWQEALHLDSFGIHDNFFDLGGHSILAVGVVSRIEAALERPCALGLLFIHPTVAALAAALAQQTASAERFTDVPVAVLQPHGTGPGLFLLAGAEMYRRLALQLDPEMPVYGVFSQTEIDLLQLPAEVEPPHVSVETLAGEYLTLIRATQPHGPYFLGGFSIGGALAYEVAQRLQQAGEEIGLIVLFDSMLPGHGFKHLLAGVIRRLRLLRRDGLRHLLHIYRVYRYQTEHRHEPGSRRVRVYAQAMRAYNAVPSVLPVLFLQAGDDASTAPAYGWRSLVPELTVERVPGKHMDILEPPNVEVSAAHVRARIAAARPAVACNAPAASTLPPSKEHVLSASCISEIH
ncbi:MAG TPA: amino acid adenylation domain-containing protein [Hydrogenophaga sp.]|nr:amino acid adenylation domain-containing protein [Hydrogenophaga sp.]